MAVDVLFVCVHNAARSQMAKAVFNELAQSRGLTVKAEPAGTIPANHAHPEAVEALKEIGVNISAEEPKLLSDTLLAGFPRVITMGCEVNSEAYPAVLMTDVVDWGFPDAEGHQVRFLQIPTLPR